ncbi:MAG: hypothetical protein ACLRIS_13635 [Flavonifractor plautii]
MKERLLSIASGGTRKKGGPGLRRRPGDLRRAAACSLGTAGEPRQLNGIFDRENYALRGVGSMWRPLTRPAALSSIWGI